MHTRTHQRGVTAIGWMIILALIGFFVLLALRMVPVYMDYFKVVSSLESIEEEKGFNSAGEIRKLLERRFDVNYVAAIALGDVKIKPKGDVYIVSVDYEKREPVFANVYVVMDFEKEVQAKKF